MSILYDETQQAIGTEADRILQLRADQARQLELVEGQGEVDERFWQTVVEQGWTGITIPEAHGGLGLGLVELGIVAQACGTHLSGAPFLPAGHGVAAALLAGGSEVLRQEWLPRLAAGDVRGCIAFSERQSPLPSRPEVTFTDGVVTGTKLAVTGGLYADVALVWASGDAGPVLALVRLDTVGRQWFDSFDNSRATAHLSFDATPAALVAQDRDAETVAMAVLAEQAVIVAHEQAGGAGAMMLRARDYALERRAFGQPIGAFQSVKHRIAELYCLTELARANAVHAAARHGTPDFLRAAAAARMIASEAYDTASRDCVQIHGGMGVTWEAGLHLHMRRARSLAIEIGNNLFWEEILCRQISEDGR